MSSIAGPSSHAFSSLPAHSRQPISTKLRQIQDAGDTATSTGEPATPVLTTAPTTAPPTPIGRSSSTVTDPREVSQGPAGTANDVVENGINGRKSSEEKRRDPRAVVVTNLDSVKARTIALSQKHTRDPEEEEAMVQTAMRVAERLAEDQRAALFPDVDTPFVDAVDVVNRLLPYHVFQQPKEDLEALLQNRSPYVSRKGKRKATEVDFLREEIADTKFALDCWKRRRALEKRFREARIRPGKRASPDEQSSWLAIAVLEVERLENTALTAELRSTRAELDKIAREKRAAAPPPTTSSTTTPRATSTLHTATSSGYFSSPSTTSTPTTTTFMPPYRPSFYSYSQFPRTQYTYNPHAYTSYTPNAPTAYGTSTPATPYKPPVSAATTTPTSAASAQVQQAAQSQSQPSAISSAAIPVQLPTSSLTALAALGIVPVAASSLPPAGQPQPPAVIKSTNGTMLSLEINLSLLQSAQMSGLILILNALTSRGVNVDGSASGATATSPASIAHGSSGAMPPTSAAPAASTPSASPGTSAASSASTTPPTT